MNNDPFDSNPFKVATAAVGGDGRNRDAIDDYDAVYVYDEKFEFHQVSFSFSLVRIYSYKYACKMVAIVYMMAGMSTNSSYPSFFYTQISPLFFIDWTSRRLRPASKGEDEVILTYPNP